MAKKPAFDFEWFTISYRAIWATAFVVLTAVGFVSYHYFLSAQPSRSAESDLKNLEFRLEQLSGKVRHNVNLRRQHEEATEMVSRAWDAFTRKDTAQAGSIAQQASEKILKIEEELERLRSGYSARIVSIEGSVKIKRAGDFRWLDAKAGMDLKEGDKVRAGDRGSAEIVYVNGDRQVLMPGSMCEIFESQVDPVTSAERVSLRVSGATTTLTTQRKRHEGSYTRLLTEHAAVEVPGTVEAELSVNPREKDTETRVMRGTGVRLKDTRGREHEIQPQTAATVSAEGDVATRNLPPAPQLLAPQTGQPFVFADPKEGAVTLRWEIDSRVHRYRMVLSNSKNFATTLVDQNTLRPDPKGVQLKGLVKGTYYWRVSAIDSTGFESPFSETRTFRIISEEPGTSDEAPPLDVTETVQIGPFLLIKGKTSPGAYLTIGDKRFDMKDDGTFDAMVKLDRLGENRIVVTAQSPSGAKTTRTVVFYLEQ